MGKGSGLVFTEINYNQIPILFMNRITLFTVVLLILTSACASQEAVTSNESEQDSSDNAPVASEMYVNEINELANSELIQQAFQFIEDIDDETVETQIHLTEIPAPPFMEEERAIRYAELMKEYGLDDVTIDEEGNVIGKRPGSNGERTIVLSAHLDTVFPEETDVNVTVRNDTLYAPGITDDTRGLSVILTVLRAFEEQNIETNDNVWFVGTVGEEGLGDLRGVKHLFREGGPNIDAFISIDGSNDSRIVNKALGSHRYRVTFEGPGGHSWGAFGIANPAHALGHTISKFDEDASGFVQNVPRTSYNVGRISGGTSVNSVPFENWMEVDMRSIDDQSLQEIDDILQSSVQYGLEKANDIRQEGPALTVDVDMIGNRPSGEISPDEPFIQRAIAASLFFDKDPSLTRSSTDSNVSISMGIPSMTLGGGGNSSGAHSLDEWWVNDNGYIGIQRVFLIVASEAGILVE